MQNFRRDPTRFPSELPDLHFSYRYHLNKHVALIGEIDLTDEWVTLSTKHSDSLGYYAQAGRSLFSPSIGAGYRYKIGPIEANVALLAGIRFLYSEGAGGGYVQSGALSGAYAVGIMDSSTGSRTSTLPTVKLRAGLRLPITSRLAIFGDVQFGIDLIRYDPNIYERVSTLALPSFTPVDSHLEHFTKGSVRQTYVYGTVGLSFSFGKMRPTLVHAGNAP